MSPLEKGFLTVFGIFTGGILAIAGGALLAKHNDNKRILDIAEKAMEKGYDVSLNGHKKEAK